MPAHPLESAKSEYAFRVPTGARVRLTEHDTAASAGLSKDQAEAALAPRLAELSELQEELFGAGQHALLVVLQGRDASGKDGVIRNVIHSFNPQGVHGRQFAPLQQRQSLFRSVRSPAMHSAASSPSASLRHHS